MTTCSEQIYFDYAATTPVDPRVADRLCCCLTQEGCFANPASSSHERGRTARGMVERARRQVASLVNADPAGIIWTSGATESNNLAIKGVAHFYGAGGAGHIITSRTEHKAVLDTCHALEEEGYAVTYLVPDADGTITPAAVRDAIRDNTLCVSIMHVNNEIGIVQDIAAIGAVCRAAGVRYHVDAAQSAGKVPIDLATLPVDLMSFSAHKVYGPKGIGALFVRQDPKTALAPLIHGGGQEHGMRSGTLATHQIVGMGECFAIASEELQDEAARLKALKERLWEGVCTVGDVQRNGPSDRCAPGILNVSFVGVEGESLLFALRKLCVSSGSACSSASAEPSYVLRAIGRSDELAQSSIRFSVGRYTSEADVDFAIANVREAVPRLRALAPN